MRRIVDDTEIDDTAQATAAAEPAEPRVYSGGGQARGTDFVRGNRPLKRRKRSPFKLISILVTTSLLILFYVWNKIEVNDLAGERDSLRKQLDRVRNDNYELRGKIDQSINLNRIKEYSMRHLGMQDPRDLPVWFDVPEYVAGMQSGDRVEAVIGDPNDLDGIVGTTRKTAPEEGKPQ